MIIHEGHLFLSLGRENAQTLAEKEKAICAIFLSVVAEIGIRLPTAFEGIEAKYQPVLPTICLNSVERPALPEDTRSLGVSNPDAESSGLVAGRLSKSAHARRSLLSRTPCAEFRS